MQVSLRTRQRRYQSCIFIPFRQETRADLALILKVNFKLSQYRCEHHDEEQLQHLISKLSSNCCILPFSLFRRKVPIYPLPFPSPISTTMLRPRDYNTASLAQSTNCRSMLISGSILFGTQSRIPSKGAARFVATLPHYFCSIDGVQWPVLEPLASVSRCKHLLPLCSML